VYALNLYKICDTIFIYYRRIETIGSGQYSICEMTAIQKEFPNFQDAFKNLETKLISKANLDWKPRTFGALALNGSQYGRTTILPPLFNDHSAAQMATFRQLFTVAGHQTLMTGAASGDTIPEDFKVALMGFAFPSSGQNITEIKMAIGDRKFNRIDLQEMRQYETPALIFEEGYTIDEEETFDLYGYVEGPIPTAIGSYAGLWQRIVPIGASYFKMYDKVGGAPGSAISLT
jgi:hypothetical protein